MRNGLGKDRVHEICEIFKNNLSIKKINLSKYIFANNIIEYISDFLGNNKFSVKDVEIIAQGLKTRRESLLLFDISIFISIILTTI